MQAAVAFSATMTVPASRTTVTRSANGPRPNSCGTSGPADPTSPANVLPDRLSRASADGDTGPGASVGAGSKSSRA